MNKIVITGMIMFFIICIGLVSIDAWSRKRQLDEMRREPTTTEILDNHLNHELEVRKINSTQKIESLKRFTEMHSWMVANGVPRTSIISVGVSGVEVKLAYPWYDTIRDREVSTFDIDTPRLAAKCVADYQKKFGR